MQPESSKSIQKQESYKHFKFIEKVLFWGKKSPCGDQTGDAWLKKKEACGYETSLSDLRHVVMKRHYQLLGMWL